MRFHLGLSFKPKNILKWLGLILFGLSAFMNIFDVHATVIDSWGPGGSYSITANGSNIKYRWVSYAKDTKINLSFDYLDPGNTLGCIPGVGCYVRYTLCVDADILSMTGISSNVSDISFNKTGNSCSYANSSYTGGKVAYLDYFIDPIETGNEAAHIDYRNTIQLVFNKSVSIQANQVEISNTSFELSTGEAVSQIQDSINNQTTTIVNNNNMNTNKIVNSVNNMTDKIFSSNEKINNTITDETPPKIDNDTFGDITLDTNSSISNLVTMPLTLLNAINNNLNSPCEPWVLPFGLTGGDETITLPCIKMEKYLGDELWGYIDLFICLFMVYNIAMLIISSYESITSLEDTFASLYEPRHARPLGKHTKEVD